MKKMLMLTLMLILCLACVVAAQAEELKSGGYIYVLMEDGTAKITKCDVWWETSLEIPAELNGHRVTEIGDEAFYWCSGVTSFTIPDSVTSIGNRAFSSNLGLTSFAIPESVTSIGDGVFLDCFNLTSVIISDSVTAVGTNPFMNCSRLTSLLISPNHPALALVDGVLFSKTDKRLICYLTSKTDSSYTIPQGIISIGGNAFYNCDRLTSVSIPDSVNTVGANPFEGCEKLKNILVSPEHPVLMLIDGVLFSKEDKRLICYLQSNTDSSYIIPQDVVSIGDYAFTDCDRLNSITIPDSTTSIGHQAFYSCSNLTSITLPDSVTSIGDSAFSFCDSLTLTVNPGSYGEQYCKDNALPYKYPDASLDWLNN